MPEARRRRVLLLLVVGVVLVSVVVLWSSPGDADAEGDDPPCFASRLGLPCR